MNKIRDLRKSKGWTQEELGEKLGINKVTVSGYESEKRQPTPDMLIRLADLFGVSVDVILGRGDEKKEPVGKPIDPDDPRFTPVVVVKQPLPDLSAEIAPVPILGSVRAGYDYVADQELLGYLNLDEHFVRLHPDVFALYVKGDSMTPEIRHNDIAVCLPGVEIHNNDVAIVCVNGDEGTVKRVRFEDGGLTLIPANPRYKPVHYAREDINTLPVILQSKVVEIRHHYG